MINVGKTIPYILETPIRLPLDGVPLANIIRANGTIQLLTDYGGALVNVQDETALIPTDVSGVDGFITEASILGVGNNVETLRVYDQSGNGLDITQSNVTLMPYMAIAGAVQQNSLGIVGISKTATTQSMKTASATIPKDFTHIVVYSAAAGDFLSIRDGSWVSNKYLNLAYTDRIFFRSYGTTNITDNAVGYGGADLTKGVVCVMAHNDTAGDFRTWKNDLLFQSSPTAGLRSSSSAAQNFMTRFSAAVTNPYNCYVDIMIDGTDYAEIIKNRLVAIFAA